MTSRASALGRLQRMNTTSSEVASTALSTGTNPFAWLIALLCAATLITAIIAAAVIGSNVNSTNSMLRSVQNSQLATVNASCNAKAEERKQLAYQVRVDAAFDQYSKQVPCHLNNGDEQRYAGHGYYASYSKSLPHDGLGHVNVTAYLLLLNAAESGLPSDWEKVPLAPGAVKKLTNPLAAEAFMMEGGDSHSFDMPPAPQFNSAEHAADMVENYWMALLRDVPFANYSTHPLAAQAIADLNALSDYRGLKPVTAQNLFRGVEPGCNVGPMISQFMYRPCPFGATFIDQRIRTYSAGVDFITTFSEYLSIQNGQTPSAVHTFETAHVFIRNGRDLARFAHMDVLYQAYFTAALVLLGINAPLKSTLPYQGVTNSAPFGTFGNPFIMQLSARSAVSALEAAWFSKWKTHRRLRPEVTGARVDRHKRGLFTYDIHPDLLNSAGAALTNATFGTWLLPQAYIEGCPTHPSYGAGHATVAGAAVTLLKAFFDESYVIPNPLMPNPADNGQTVISLVPLVNLTVGGELNKVASNIAIGRHHGSVHYRSDGYHSLRLGEKVAISMLKDIIRTLPETFEAFQFTSFDGNVVVIKK